MGRDGAHLAGRGNRGVVGRHGRVRARRRDADNAAHAVRVEPLTDSPGGLEPALWNVQADDAEAKAVAVLQDVEPAGAVTVGEARALAAHVLEHWQALRVTPSFAAQPRR